MKLRRVAVENVKSFLERQELELPGDISILIGPNGGGKTNLLDTASLALRMHLLKSWTPRHSPAQDWPNRYEWVSNDDLRSSLLEKHSAGAARPQIIELDIEMTAPDVSNILRTKAEAQELRIRASKKYTSCPGSPQGWVTEGLEPGQVFTFTVRDGRLAPELSPRAETFRQYLDSFEADSRLREELSEQPLSMPMITLPVHRSGGRTSASVTLAQFNEYDLKRHVDAASSASAGSIATLAVGRLATRYRQLLERDDGNAKSALQQDPAIKEFTATLHSIGYAWTLESVDPLKNQYDVVLKKQGTAFKVDAASSGERELLVYLFAVYALNVRDALIVVDEPELHLHPRWQQLLIALFERLARETGNQFLLATHSPVFVSPATIQHVSRVYADRQRSRIVRLGAQELPEKKHLFSIVNSQNNERIFFADLVVLVEGISDRIFFEAAFKRLEVGARSGKVFEIVEVSGKSLFGQYERLLQSCRVPSVVIADLDYVRELSNGALSSLFETDARRIGRSVSNAASLDGAAIAEAIESALNLGSVEPLRSIWEYAKARTTRLRSDLSEVNQKALKLFLEEQAREGRFILSEGDLEMYLPSGHQGKDVEKLIRLVHQENFWDALPKGRDEIEQIAQEIDDRLQGMSANAPADIAGVAEESQAPS